MTRQLLRSESREYFLTVLRISSRAKHQHGWNRLRTRCVPLLLTQGITWLKLKEESRNLQILRLGQKDVLRRLQEAMERGFSVIIENMGETIDPMILPVVTRAFTRRGNRSVILLGDDEVEQHPEFRLFLHTKLSNPHYPPEVQAETTIVNFMVTPTGLEDQLLAVVIKTERPDLAAHKAALLQQQNQFKARASASPLQMSLDLEFQLL